MWEAVKLYLMQNIFFTLKFKIKVNQIFQFYVYSFFYFICFINSKHILSYKIKLSEKIMKFYYVFPTLFYAQNESKYRLKYILQVKTYWYLWIIFKCLYLRRNYLYLRVSFWPNHFNNSIWIILLEKIHIYCIIICIIIKKYLYSTTKVNLCCIL